MQVITYKCVVILKKNVILKIECFKVDSIY